MKIPALAKKPIFAAVTSALVAGFIRLVKRTSSTIYEPPGFHVEVGAHQPFILAMWQGQFMMLADLNTSVFKVSAIVSRHGDGDLTAATLKRFGIDLTAATSRFFTLNTWSRMTVNLPFSKLAFVAGEPLFVPANADERMLELARRKVERSLDAVVARAYALAGAEALRAVSAASRQATPTHGRKSPCYRPRATPRSAARGNVRIGRRTSTFFGEQPWCYSGDGAKCCDHVWRI